MPATEFEQQIDDELDTSSDTSGDSEIESAVNEIGFAKEKDIASDHRLYDQSKYERVYTWLYYNHTLNGYMCKVCDIFYTGTECPTGGDRGAWSHVAVKFHDNAGKKLRRHDKSDKHTSAINAMTNLRIEQTIGNKQNDDR